ncbi:uncharacterized protein H6S33_012356 [Morchella sextelata]|uniref:uncharacterized protein n=1 Tax=Morchella sextelata TaxID=1174677 RepID=UPI001D04EE2D|nr:uncharacterized protein H6S33_012356 [Morchella sextelata]KAH0609810.1 hypothetical protein H6S33_012356 [Morchella sextelata]
MTSIAGSSPSPKPRSGRNNHRQTKSSSFIAAPNQFNPKHHAQPIYNNQTTISTTHIASATNYRGSTRSAIMTPPTTPKAQHFPNAGTDTSGKKRKNKKQDKPKQEKPKPKNVATKIQAGFTPEAIPVDLESPPMSSDEFPSGQITPSKLSSSSTPPSMKAYAGPTFHHSPAPSALPMPKFFSKSVPGTPAGTSLQAMMESDASDTNSNTAESTSTEQEQSHLELLFNAARAENMSMKRQDSGSPPSSDAAIDSFSGVFGANVDPESPTRNNRKVTRNIPQDSLFFSMDELDKPTSPMAPTFKERMNQSRSITAPSNLPTQSTLEEDKRKETAKALRQYLLSPLSPTNKVQASPMSPVSTQSRAQRAQNPNRAASPSSKAGPPMAFNPSAYQPQSPRSPAGPGYFPMAMFPYSGPSHLEQQNASYVPGYPPRTSPANQAPTRPRLSPANNIPTYMNKPSTMVPFFHHNPNSILASKLEAVASPVIQQSVIELENDLRKVLMI